jgi:hypothetical protein
MHIATDACPSSDPSRLPEFEALFPNLALLAATHDLLHRAGDLADSHALHGYDVVHLASVEANGDPETAMVTTDHQLHTAATRVSPPPTSRPSPPLPHLPLDEWIICPQDHHCRL